MAEPQPCRLACVVRRPVEGVVSWAVGQALGPRAPSPEAMVVACACYHQCKPFFSVPAPTRQGVDC